MAWTWNDWDNRNNFTPTQGGNGEDLSQRRAFYDALAQTPLTLPFAPEPRPTQDMQRVDMPNPFADKRQKDEFEDSPRPKQIETPITNAAQPLKDAFPNMNRGFANLLGAGAATVQGIGKALVGAWGETKGDEVGAVPFGNVARSLPGGIGLGQIGAEALFPQYREASKTPLRDVPVLGQVTRAGEALGGAGNAGYETVSKPAIGAMGLVRDQIPEPLRESIRRNAPTDTISGAVNALLGNDNPQLYNEMGASPDEARNLLGGFLNGTNTPEQDKRFEEITRKGYESESEANPVSSTIIGALTDPTTWLDASMVLPKIGAIKNLRRAWEAGGDVMRAGEAIGDASPLEKLLYKAFQPKNLAKGELLADEAKKANVIGRVLKPFEDTPTTKVIKTIERVLGNMQPYLTDASRSFADKVKMLDLMGQAAKDGKLTDNLLQFMGEQGIKNAPDYHRSVRAAMNYSPKQIVEEYKRAQEILASLRQTTQTKNAGKFSEDIAGFVGAEDKGLSKGYQNIFDRVLEQWKAGKLDLDEAARELENMAGVRLSNDLTQHMANALPKQHGVKTPNFITKLVETMKAYEGLLYIGANPASMVQNFVGDISRMAQFGVNPAEFGRGYAELTKRIGYRPPENIGGLVREAVTGIKGDDVSAFGANLPDWIKKTPILKQMNAAFQKSQTMGRELAWATGFERFMARNFTPPAFTPAMQSHFGGDAARMLERLKEARNYKEAEDILFRGMPTFGEYKEQVAQALTEQFSRIAGRPFEITPDMLTEALDPARRERVRRILGEAWERVQKGDEASNAFRQARARITAEDVKSDDFSDLWGARPEPPEIPLTQPIRQAQAPTPKPPDVPPDVPTAPAPVEPPPTQPPSAPQAGLRIPPQTGAPAIDKGVQDFARVLAQEPELPNILKGRVEPSEWAQMDAYGRTTLLERALAGERNAGNFPLSDVYQGRGDVPTPMPDVRRVIESFSPDGALVLSAESQDGLNRVAGQVHDNILRIVLADVNEAQRGKGIGTSLYRELIDDALARGLKVESDATVTQDAARVYESLGRKGYNVVKSPNVRTTKSGAWFVGEDSPVFLVEGRSEGGAALRRIGETDSIGSQRGAMASGITQPSDLTAPDLSDVFRKAIEKQVPTATQQGRTVNQHLLNVLNKHKEANAARFATIEDVKARADEAIAILDNYTPEAKAVEGAPKEVMTETGRQSLKDFGYSDEEIADIARQNASPDVGKKAFEQTKQEYVDAALQKVSGKYAKKQRKMAEDFHRGFVRDALSEGKPVPAEVLADYPDLAKKYAPAQVADVAPTAPRTDFSGNWFVEDDGTGKRIDFKSEKAMRKWLETKTGNAPAQAAEQAGGGDLLTIANRRGEFIKDLSADMERVQLARSRGKRSSVNLEKYAKKYGISSKGYQPLDKIVGKAQIDTLDIGGERPQIQEIISRIVDEQLGETTPRNAADAQLRGIDPYAQSTISAEERLRRVLNAAQQEGASAVTNGRLNEAGSEAMTDMMLDAIEKAFAEQAQRAANVMPPDVVNEIRQYLKQAFMPELNTAKQMANSVARQFVDATVLNYDHRWNIDEGMGLAAPFTYWWLHTLANYTQNFIDHPAYLAFLMHLRERIDKESEGMPDRFKHKIEIAIPGSPDTLWTNPMRTLAPFPDVFQLDNIERAGYTAVGEDGTPDYGNVFQDLFGIHTPYKLAHALLTGKDADVKNIIASIPAARLLRSTTGIGIEGKYDQAYYERAMKELVADGTLTEEQAKVALLQQKGRDWETIKQRAGLENYTVPNLTALTGFRGTPFTAGERKYYETRRARDTMLDAAVRRMGGNPNMSDEARYEFLNKRDYFKSDEWQQFKEQNPELDAASFANKAYGDNGQRLPQQETQDARARDYYVSAIWDAYRAAPELKQKLIAADLGDEFKNTFLGAKGDYSKIPMRTLLGWANALDTMLQEPVAGGTNPIPDPFKVTFTTDDQNKRYQDFYDGIEQSFGWANVHDLERQYFAIDDKAQRAAFLKQNPMLKLAWDNESKFYADNNDLLRIMERAGLKQPKTNAPQEATKGSALAQAVEATGLNWDTINAKKAEYNKLPKGTGARTAYLKQNPDLLRYFQLAGAIYNEDTELQTQGGGSGSSTYTRHIYVPRAYQGGHYAGKQPQRIYLNIRSFGNSHGQTQQGAGQGQNNYTPRRISAGGY